MSSLNIFMQNILMEKEVFHRKPRMRLFHKSHYRKSHGLTSQPDNAWAEFSTIIIGVRPYNLVLTAQLIIENSDQC
jgi:hypothetical protein